MATRVIPRDQLDDFTDAGDVKPKGEAAAVKTVFEFLEECQLSEEDGDVTLDLVQQSRGSGVQQPVCSFTVRAGEDLQEFAQQVVDDAIRDAREGGCSGKVRYAVKASGRRGRKTFLLTFPSTGDDDFDETPNERGALAQTMRQNAELHQIVKDLVNDMNRTQRQIIDGLLRDKQKHEDLSGKNWAIFADLVTAQHERQLSLTKADRGEKRMDEVAGFLMTAGQLVFNSFLGKRVFQNAPTPIEHQTYAFASSIDQEQVLAAANGQPVLFRPDQALSLFQLMRQLDEHYKAQRGGEPAPPNAFDPAQMAAAQSPQPMVTPPPSPHANGAANGHASSHSDPASMAM